MLDVYESSDMRAFVVEAYDIVWFDSEAELTETVKAEILDVMTKYRALSAQAKSLFMSLDKSERVLRRLAGVLREGFGRGIGYDGFPFD